MNVVGPGPTESHDGERADEGRPVPIPSIPPVSMALLEEVKTATLSPLSNEASFRRKRRSCALQAGCSKYSFSITIPACSRQLICIPETDCRETAHVRRL